MKDVKTLREQSGADQVARLNQLKAMTPEEFVRIPREELQELTDRQYAEVARHIATVHQLPNPPDMPERSDRSWTGLHWTGMPTIARAVLLGFLTGLLILGVSLAIGPATDWWQYRTPPVRSQEASTWPKCHRLSGWVDGCTYSLTKDMTWERAASLLQMSETELREANRHINRTYIPRLTMLVVWRHRGQLYRSTP